LSEEITVLIVVQVQLGRGMDRIMRRGDCLCSWMGEILSFEWRERWLRLGTASRISVEEGRKLSATYPWEYGSEENEGVIPESDELRGEQCRAREVVIQRYS
jgi:hypothetical protein